MLYPKLTYSRSEALSRLSIWKFAILKRILWRTILVVLLAEISIGDVALAGSFLEESDEIQLQEGWNYVALSVVPAERALEIIFESVSTEILIVKNAHGDTFVPAYDINTIGEWDVTQSYMVNARNDISFTVMGTPIVLHDTPVHLTEGWNLVPFLLQEDKSLEETFASIAGHIVAVKDHADNFYFPDHDIHDLEILRPGSGYLVYVDADVTLTYSMDQPAPGGGDTEFGDYDYEVDTIAEAVALTDLVLGERVYVRGYSQPGDGGGGEFVVSDSNCAPDGGTCFVPVKFTAQATAGPIQGSRNLSHQNIVFGSVQLFYNDTEYVESLELHGHRMWAGGRKHTLEHGEGSVNDYGQLSDLSNRFGGNRQWRIDYRYATSSLRLERSDAEGSYVSVNWWGARPADPDNIFDATDHIAWATNIAARIAEQRNQVVDVIFDDMYYYDGVIEHKHNVRWRGAVEGVRDGQGMIVIPRGAERWFRERLPSSNDLRVQRRPRSLLQNSAYILLKPDPNATFMPMRDLEVNGNVEGHALLMENPTLFGEPTNSSYPTQVHHILQNTAFWNAYVASEGSGGGVEDSHILMENVHLHSFGGNIILTDGYTYFDGSRDLKLGNSAKNHAIYDMRTKDGHVENLEFYGYGFGSLMTTFQGHYRNVKLYDLVDYSPLREPDGSLAQQLNYPVERRRQRSFVEGSHGRWFYGNEVLIENLEYDMTGNSRIRNAFFLQDDNFHVDGFTITTFNGGAFSLIYTREANLPSRPFENLVIENGTILRRTGQTNALTSYEGYYAGATFRNIEVIEQHPDPQDGMDLLGARIRDNSRSRQIYRFDNVIYDRLAAHGLLIVRGDDPDAHGIDVFIDNSALNNQEALVRQHSGSVPADARVVWRNSRFNVNTHSQASRSFANHLSQSYFENCVDAVTGRRSEDSGTLNYSADGGEQFIEIETNIFWEPKNVNASLTSGNSNLSVTDVEVTNVSGNDKRFPRLRVKFNRSLHAGEQLSIQWSAAVRPIPDQGISGL